MIWICYRHHYACGTGGTVPWRIPGNLHPEMFNVCMYSAIITVLMERVNNSSCNDVITVMTVFKSIYNLPFENRQHIMVRLNNSLLLKMWSSCMSALWVVSKIKRCINIIYYYVVHRENISSRCSRNSEANAS